MGLHSLKTIPPKVGGLRPRRGAILNCEKSSKRQETSVEVAGDGKLVKVDSYPAKLCNRSLSVGCVLLVEKVAPS
jgi:hypothetical protein